mmetsp:Transcript_5473/g.15192  ORF Transcript_5473/g.15192 Transcript_5473/m.15192 type:complete len:174 (-) Transcript_5473:120-641(-)
MPEELKIGDMSMHGHRAKKNKLLELVAVPIDHVMHRLIQCGTSGDSLLRPHRRPMDFTFLGGITVLETGEPKGPGDANEGITNAGDTGPGDATASGVSPFGEANEVIGSDKLPSGSVSGAKAAKVAVLLPPPNAGSTGGSGPGWPRTWARSCCSATLVRSPPSVRGCWEASAG